MLLSLLFLFPPLLKICNLDMAGKSNKKFILDLITHKLAGELFYFPFYFPL